MHDPTTQQHMEALFSGTAHLQLPERIEISAWTTHVPFAFWVVEASAPKILVELGTHAGVSFCAFCQQVAKSDLETMCYAVDTWEGDPQAGYYSEDVRCDLEQYLEARYRSFAHLIPATFDDALPLFQEGSIDLLHIDGFHSYEDMTHDFSAWLPKMSPRGVILMHDINARKPGYGGIRAWEDTAAHFPRFAFTHGYGLGVVLTGDDPPENLRRLVEYGQDILFRERVRHRFSLLGAFHQKLMEYSLALARERESLAAAAARAEALRAEVEDRRREHLQERVRLEAACDSLLAAYARSASWRFAKPLRMAAGLWRSLRGLPPRPEPPIRIADTSIFGETESCRAPRSASPAE